MSDIVYVWITFKSVDWSKLITLQGVIGVIQLGNGFDTSKTGEFCSELIDQYSPRVFQSLSHILSLSSLFFLPVSLLHSFTYSP